MDLSKLLDGVSVAKIFQTMYGRMIVTHDVQVRTIQYDSRKVSRDDLFIAIKGSAVDGHKFITNAISQGAKVVVVEDDSILPDSYFMHAGVVKVVVPDSRKALARLAANFYHHPSRKLRLIGVTGTNGKTTTTFLLKSILEAAAEKVGLIGTIEYRVGDRVVAATHTTPESLELNALLAQMADEGCTSVVMEVSSHSLAMHRVSGLKFAAGVFTNLTQDHLDFHGSMDEYFRAKKLLFDSLDDNAYAIANSDDARGLDIIAGTSARHVLYGVHGTANYTAADISLSLSGTTFSVESCEKSRAVKSSLIGDFNVYNIMAAYATAVSIGIKEEQIDAGINNLRSVPGRFQHVTAPAGWVAVVDYAHTPDALENCLYTLRKIVGESECGRIISIFGCGGDRDKGKRPLMGKIASELSDITIITSDNPRTEDPNSIIEQIKGGVLEGKAVFTETDRRTAIQFGVSLARKGDMVLIAGKGHENYQVIGTKKIHFDDREEVNAYINRQ